LRVAGIHVEHAVRDSWAGSVHRSPQCAGTPFTVA
jgi:hypothetical protein